MMRSLQAALAYTEDNWDLGSKLSSQCSLQGPNITRRLVVLLIPIKLQRLRHLSRHMWPVNPTPQVMCGQLVHSTVAAVSPVLLVESLNTV